MRWRSPGSSAEPSDERGSQAEGEKAVFGKSEEDPKHESPKINDEESAQSNEEPSTESLSISELTTSDFRQMHIGNLVGCGQYQGGNLPAKPAIPVQTRKKDEMLNRRGDAGRVKTEIKEERTKLESIEEVAGSVITRERREAPSGVGVASADASGPVLHPQTKMRGAVKMRRAPTTEIQMVRPFQYYLDIS